MDNLQGEAMNANSTKNFFAKYKLFFAIALGVVLLLSVVFAIFSPSVNAKGEYYYYTYDTVKGKFTKTNEKIHIEKGNNYTFYDTNGTIKTIAGSLYKGKYSATNNGICIAVGDVLGQTFTDSIFYAKYKNYLIDYTAATAMVQVTNNRYAAKNKLEGFYLAGGIRLYFSGKKVYTSVNNSNIEESFTEQIGKYSVKGDILTFTDMENISTQLLVFDFKNALGQTNKALTSAFYSKKTVKTSAPAITNVALENEVFAKATSNLYAPVIIKYPSKKPLKYQNLVIVGDYTSNSDAVIENGKIKCTGTGSVEFKVVVDKDISFVETIDIVDISLVSPTPAIAKDDMNFVSSLITNTADFYHFESTLKFESTATTITFTETGTGTLTIYCTWAYRDLEGNFKSVVMQKNMSITVS